MQNLIRRVNECDLCALSRSRTRPVFGAGSFQAGLMFVGEAPGYHEDQRGEPFVGQAGKLLERLLEGIGLAREDVFIANVLKCRPPDNRDPLADEIEKCRRFLEEQISLIGPRVICTLGNFATKLLSGRPDGISRVHGQEAPVNIGGKEIVLFPVFHPAAALYTPSNLKSLETDFKRLAGILGLKDKPQVENAAAAAGEKKLDSEVKVDTSNSGNADEIKGSPSDSGQLGLF